MSDLFDINFGSLPVEPTSPTPGTPTIEVHFTGPSDQASDVSNETKSDTDSTAPMDTWSVSTQYPESRADVESVKDIDAKSEQSIDDKSQVAEDGSDTFDFPTPQENVEQKDAVPGNNLTDSSDFDFPSSEPQPQQTVKGNSGTLQTEEPSREDVLLTPAHPLEDKQSEAHDETISVSSDTVPVNPNDFTFEDEFKVAPSTDTTQLTSDAKSDSPIEQLTTAAHDKNPDEAVSAKSTPESTQTQTPEAFFESVSVENVAKSDEKPVNNITESSDFDFPAPSSQPEPQAQPDQANTLDKPEHKSETADIQITVDETPASTSASDTINNDFTFKSEFTTSEYKQPEESGTGTVEEVETKKNIDVGFEGESTSAPTPTAGEKVEENKPTEETSQAKSENDFDFETEFTSAPSLPASAETTQLAEEKKSENDFEGEFTPAPVPATNTSQAEDDDFFESEFQAAPTTQQAPQPQAPSGTFEADFDDDFEEFAQAPTTPQPPVQPPQPVVTQTQWLFEGSEAEVHDRVYNLVSNLFPAPVPSKVLPDINATVEEKLEELHRSAPAVDTQYAALPAPSLFAEHLKELLASVVSTLHSYIRAGWIVDRSFHWQPRPNRAPQPPSPASNLRELVLNDPRLIPIYRKKRFWVY